MKMYIRTSSYPLESITKQNSWMYKPFDKDTIIYKNPIQYAGDDMADKVVTAYYSFRYICVSEDREYVDLNTLKSVQAFVTADGLNNDFDTVDDIFAVRLDGQLYLMNGNHRVAIAYLQGRRYYSMLVRTLVKDERKKGDN